MDTSTQSVMATTEEQIRKAAHDAVLATYSDEARKAYPEGWNEEENSDFQEWVDRHADTMTKESQSESQSGVAANEEPDDTQGTHQDPTRATMAGEHLQFSTPIPHNTEPTCPSGRDLRDEGAGQQTQFV